MWLAVPEGRNASALLATVRLKGVPGTLFGVGPNHVRLNMLETDSTFELILQRLEALCSGPGTGGGLLGLLQRVEAPAVTEEGLAWERHRKANRRLWRYTIGA